MNNINENRSEIEEINKSKPGSTSGVGKYIRRHLKIVLPLLLILFTVLVVTGFSLISPQAPPRKPNLTPPLTVSVINVEARDFQVNVQSFGTVAPQTQSFLTSQVSGVVTQISDSLRAGSFFDKGDVLLQLDDRDYLADLKISQANLADARQALSQELAQSSQAQLDWQRLGNVEPANDLVLRKPQQLAAQATLASAEATLSKAQLGLDRTKVIAPFDGRVLNKMVDLGQVSGSNSQIAEVYATDYLEIRLPIRDSDLPFVNLPEEYRNQDVTPEETSVKVFSSLTKSKEPWLGKIVRTESAIDDTARQLHVVAQINDPFGEAAIGRTPLKIGEYVTAEIQGKLIKNALVIPSSTIYQNTYVYVVEDNIVIRRNVEVLWQSTNKALIGIGLKDGDRLVTTTLGQVASGTRIAIDGETKQPKNQGRNKTNAPARKSPKSNQG